jgi:hypothetical protein
VLQKKGGIDNRFGRRSIRIKEWLHLDAHASANRPQSSSAHPNFVRPGGRKAVTTEICANRSEGGAKERDCDALLAMTVIIG